MWASSVGGVSVKIAVGGGTGLVGRATVDALRRAGHVPAVIARATGVDLMTGEGLEEALDGVDAVIDATNFPVQDPEQARARFGQATARLLTAEQATGVRHHIVLSIACLDRVKGNAHYAGKREQERLAMAGPVPASILRATQFFEFGAMVVAWTRRGDAAQVPPLLLQPVAVGDVAEVLVEVAAGAPMNGSVELAGPEPQDLVDMARRTLAARGESIRLVPTWRGPFGVEAAGEALLPGPDARIAPTTFEAWLETQRPA